MTGGNDFSDRMCHFVTFIDTTLIAQTKNVLSAAINVNYFLNLISDLYKVWCSWHGNRFTFIAVSKKRCLVLGDE